MSGVVKSVGKVFKKVAKVATKIAPVALAAAAIYFTAGAALGAGVGWGGTVTGAVSKLGLSGGLANIVGGAITQAGYGAAIGGITSAVTGGGFVKGAQLGTATGLVTGGVTGAMGLNGAAVDNAVGLGPNQTPQAVDPTATSVNLERPEVLVPGNPPRGESAPLPEVTVQPAPGSFNINDIRRTLHMPPQDYHFNLPATDFDGVPKSPQATVPSPAATATKTAQAPARSGFWNNMSGEFVGKVAGGLGEGIIKSAQASSDAKTELQRQREKRETIRQNYASGGAGLLTQGAVAQTIANQSQGMSPIDKFNPQQYSGGWVYDPATAKIVFVPTNVA